MSFSSAPSSEEDYHSSLFNCFDTSDLQVSSQTAAYMGYPPAAPPVAFIKNLGETGSKTVTSMLDPNYIGGVKAFPELNSGEPFAEQKAMPLPKKFGREKYLTFDGYGLCIYFMELSNIIMESIRDMKKEDTRIVLPLNELALYSSGINFRIKNTRDSKFFSCLFRAHYGFQSVYTYKVYRGFIYSHELLENKKVSVHPHDHWVFNKLPFEIMQNILYRHGLYLIDRSSYPNSKHPIIEIVTEHELIEAPNLFKKKLMHDFNELEPSKVKFDFEKIEEIYSEILKDTNKFYDRCSKIIDLNIEEGSIYFSKYLEHADAELKCQNLDRWRYNKLFSKSFKNYSKNLLIGYKRPRSEIDDALSIPPPSLSPVQDFEEILKRKSELKETSNLKLLQKETINTQLELGELPESPAISAINNKQKISHLDSKQSVLTTEKSFPELREKPTIDVNDIVEMDEEITIKIPSEFFTKNMKDSVKRMIKNSIKRYIESNISEIFDKSTE